VVGELPGAVGEAPTAGGEVPGPGGVVPGPGGLPGCGSGIEVVVVGAKGIDITLLKFIPGQKGAFKFF